MPKSTMKTSRYATHSLAAKNAGFNIPITHALKRDLGRYRRPAIHVMDAAGTHTTRCLRQHGIRGRVNVFTRDQRDYAAIDVRGLNARKRLVDAATKYARLRARDLALVDDGMQTGRNTLPRILVLLARPITNLSLACNLAMRCRKRSHDRFLGQVCAAAVARGWRVTHAERFASYSQHATGGTRMLPHYFRFTRE